MDISIVIIGKNTELTLERCLKACKSSIENAGLIAEYIYVDSISKDRSIQIAINHECQVISIVEGFTSAALGRYLGLNAAKSENICFLDSDMEVNLNWFKSIWKSFKKDRAILGERHEIVYYNGKVVREISNFKKISEKQKISHLNGSLKSIGGFLMVNKSAINHQNFNPLLRDEEEADFYARWMEHQKISAYPITAFKHHNYRLLKNRIWVHLHWRGHLGYLQSLIAAVKFGYFRSFIKLQRKYLWLIISGLLFYIALIAQYWALAVVFVGMSMLNPGFSQVSKILLLVFLPYKLVGAVVDLCLTKTTTVKINGVAKTFKIGLNGIKDKSTF